MDLLTPGDLLTGHSHYTDTEAVHWGSSIIVSDH